MSRTTLTASGLACIIRSQPTEFVVGPMFRAQILETLDACAKAEQGGSMLSGILMEQFRRALDVVLYGEEEALPENRKVVIAGSEGARYEDMLEDFVEWWGQRDKEPPGTSSNVQRVRKWIAERNEGKWTRVIPGAVTEKNGRLPCGCSKVDIAAFGHDSFCLETCEASLAIVDDGVQMPTVHGFDYSTEAGPSVAERLPEKVCNRCGMAWVREWNQCPQRCWQSMPVSRSAR